MKNSIMIIVITVVVSLHAISPGCMKNEEVIFGFRTVSNRIVSVCTGHIDTNEYIVYRYGTDSTTELEYPLKREGSFSKFFYSYYLRGGGKENEGLDINNLEFRNGGYIYKIYQEYSAADSTNRIGIRIKNEKTGKQSDIKGKPKTIIGSLINLRFDDRIPK